MTGNLVFPGFGLAADAVASASSGRRIVAVLTMFLSVFVGDLLGLYAAINAAVALALLLTVLSAVASPRNCWHMFYLTGTDAAVGRQTFKLFIA